MRKLTFLTMLAALAVSLASCSKGGKATVKASIYGAEGKTALLELANNGSWDIVDSAKVSGNSSLSFDIQRATYPDIYRLTVDGKSVYFPVDSTETVTIDAAFADMDTRSSIAGSADAEMMQKINDGLNAALAASPAAEVLADKDLKRQLASIVQSDWSSIAAYYLINKTIGNQRLYNPANAFDRNIIAAVANSYLEKKPDDPRTALLENIALSHRRAYTPGTPVEAQEIMFPELSLKDVNGNVRTLGEVWDGSKAVIVSFTAYTAEESPAYQLALGEVYSKYRDRGLSIYQVSCDSEEYRWRMAAKEIPWTAVYCAPDDAAQILRYNVQALPTTFVIDGSGEHFDRIGDIADLDATVARYL